MKRTKSAVVVKVVSETGLVDVVESRDVVELGTVDTSSKGVDVVEVEEPATGPPVQAANTRLSARILTRFN